MFKTILKLGLICMILIVITNCKDKKSTYFNYQWTAEAEALRGDALEELLLKAPFANLFYPKKDTDKNTWVITNADEVFPFMNSFKTENDDYADYKYVNQKNTVIYKDPEFGNVFLFGALLETDEELYLDQFHSTTGNMLFGGADAIYRSSSATLKETMIAKPLSNYKATIYIANATNQDYIFGHSQKDNLIIQFGIPIGTGNKNEVVNKVHEIEQRLGLDIAEWKNLTADQLKINAEPVSFWKNKFVGFYTDQESYLLPRLKLKTKGTRFENSQRRFQLDTNTDSDFVLGDSTAIIQLKRLDLEGTRDDFIQKFSKDQSIDTIIQLGDKTFNKHLYVNTTKEGELVKGIAQALFQDDKYLRINFQYAKSDVQAQKEVNMILQTMKISSLY